MWSWTNIDWEKSLTTAVAVSALVQAAVGVVMMNGLRHAARQNRIANKTLQLTEQTSERQLRAYVDVLRTTFTGFQSGKAIMAGIVIRNFGQTPARNLKTNLELRIGTIDQINNLSALPVVDTVSYTLSSGGEVTIESREPPSFWEPQQEKLNTGTLALVARGTVVYEDIFNNTRTVEFCYTCQDPKTHKNGECLMMYNCHNSAD